MAKKSVEQIYQKLTPEEHVLKRPDTYVGSVLMQEKEVWTVEDYNFDTENINDLKISKSTIKYTPALLKLFDEILTNASDHAQRNEGVKNIKVNIDKNWKITIWNDGNGIPVQIHKEHNIYIPELIFGHLHTGSNYDDTEERFGAGRNGLGSKLVSLFSKEFIIDCADGKKSYYQELINNNSNKSKPIIKSTKKSYTSISYIADFTRLPIDEESSINLLQLCLKRVIDIAVYNPNVKVYFNDELIKINNLEQWCKMHLDNDTQLFTEIINDKWSIGLAQSNTDKFEHASIVNGNTTWQGGTHVDYIINKLVKRLTTDLTKGNKGIKIKPLDIKNKFHLFLVSRIANPTFDTQTKENLTIKITDDIDLSDKLYKALLKSEIIESILEWVQMKEQAALNKMNKKSAGKTIRVDKLVDAHKAGTVNGYKASLCIAEGDSARGTVLTGLSIVGRDLWGVFPIKGRPLNVRDVPVSKIVNNDEIANIIKIIGLVPGKKYTNLKELRYGKIVFFTDADHFGISIKGLLINFIHKMWPELLELGFCYEFITPIVKASKGKIIKEYYDIEKYKKEKETDKLDGYSIKYYKGLGTITGPEIKEMFKNINKHLIQFKYIENRDSDKIDLVFNKSRAGERKDWMTNYEGEILPDKFGKPNNIDEFIDTEFIQFSNYDNVISIPHLIDGFKPSQRKIMYGAFKRNLKTETKVAQFGAYVAEQTHYAHGESNLYGTIIGMAQDFVFSNNIPMFVPKGNFGSRRDPKSAASPRYIYTYLNPLTNLIFRKEDDQILNYLYEDTDRIEPDFYLPIIPTLLINGTSGIGTGWSTDIPKYNPRAIIQVLQKKFTKPDIRYAINPSYHGWNGDLEWDADKNVYVSKGIYNYNKSKNQIIITELPVDMSTDKYISILDKLSDEKKIKTYLDNSTDANVQITVTLNPGTKATNIESLLKLTANISINNMNTFLDNKIVKWDTAEELLNTWFNLRLEYYATRKAAYIKVLEKQFNRFYNLVRFINGVIEGEITINNRAKIDIIKTLEEMEFDKINDNYDYLLTIPVYHLTKEKYEEYIKQGKAMKKELKEYKLKSPEEIWSAELDELDLALEKAGY